MQFFHGYCILSLIYMIVLKLNQGCGNTRPDLSWDKNNDTQVSKLGPSGFSCLSYKYDDHLKNVTSRAST